MNIAQNAPNLQTTYKVPAVAPKPYVPPGVAKPPAGAQAGQTDASSSGPNYGATATKAPAAAPAGGGTAPPSGSPQDVTVGAYNPDWTAILNQDPGVLGVKNANTTNEQIAAGARRSAVQKAVIAYGGLPSGFTDTYGDIDPATLQLAKENQNSTTALQAHSYATQIRQLQQALAARGALGSGELGYGLDESGRANSTALYNAGNALSDAYTGAVGAYTGVIGQNARDLGAAYQTAENTDSTLPQYQPNAGQQAAYDPTLSKQYGATVYTAPDGNTHYTLDANGNPQAWFRPNNGIAPNPDYSQTRLY